MTSEADVMPQHNYTLEIRYVNRAPETRRIDAGRVVIGRDGGDIVLQDSEASAAHAEIEFEDGQLVVRDLGSTNGTWLGQRRLAQFALSPGQVFRCGHTQIRLLEIVGGQQLVAGRTVMSDVNELPGLPLAGQAPMPAFKPAPGQNPGQSQVPPRAGASKPGAGAIVGAALGGVALLCGLGFGGWYMFVRDDAELAAPRA